MNDTDATLSTELKQGGLKSKRKLQLSIPMAKDPDTMLIFNQDTSSYQLQGECKQGDDTDTNTSSVSKMTNKFFPKEQLMNFDFEGQYYCVRGRSNGKTMQDRVKLTRIV